MSRLWELVFSTTFAFLESHWKILVESNGWCETKCINCWRSPELSHMRGCPNGHSIWLPSMDSTCGVILYKMQARTYQPVRDRTVYFRNQLIRESVTKALCRQLIPNSIISSKSSHWLFSFQNQINGRNTLPWYDKVHTVYAQSCRAVQPLKIIEWIWFLFIYRWWKSSFHPIQIGQRSAVCLKGIGRPTYPNWFHQLCMRSWCFLFFSTTVLVDNMLLFWRYLLVCYFHCRSFTEKRSTTVFTLISDSQLSHCLVRPHSWRRLRLPTFRYVLI